MKPHHFALKVNDLLNCEKFYTKILGLNILQYQKNEQGENRALWLDLAGSILMLEKMTSKISKIDHVSWDSGWHLLALSIPLSERKEWKKKLTDSGVIIQSESEYSLFFEDPEGNRLALSHYPEKKSHQN